MARVGTTYLDLGKYLDGENPGSGPQDNTLSEGMNGDKNKIDLAVGPGHNVDGSHKAGVIDGAQLASTCVDGATLEQNSTTKQLRLKDASVSIAKLAPDTVALIGANTTDLNTHKSSGDHDAHNDARYAPIGAVRLVISAPFLASGSTPHIPLPVGMIMSVVVTNEEGQVGVSTVGKNITVENTIMRITNGGGAGVLPLIVGGVQYASIALTANPQFVVITMI